MSHHVTQAAFSYTTSTQQKHLQVALGPTQAQAVVDLALSVNVGHLNAKLDAEHALKPDSIYGARPGRPPGALLGNTILVSFPSASGAHLVRPPAVREADCAARHCTACQSARRLTRSALRHDADVATHTGASQFFGHTFS